ncbi:MAG: NHLP bacteriocin export ABC transporter permease/ATPase subunit, partial [Candidatus Riflebacteria bacterium]|nr:NHLP bacteriocin export ABC transporter permease/ATPase subunit [Candidatus Riflebacteria bacterium]
GELLLGCSGPDGSSTESLVAVGLAGTRLVRLDLARFRELVDSPGRSAAAAKLIDGWITRLCSGLCPPPPLASGTNLTPGQEVELENRCGIGAGVAGSVVWLRCLGGRVRLCGVESMTLGEGQGHLPLPPGVWVEATGTVRIRTLSTAELLGQDRDWTALAGFQAMIPGWLASRRELSDRESARLLALRAEADVDTRKRSLSQLATVLLPEVDRVPSAEPGRALVAACQVLGKVLGVEIVSPKDLAEMDDPLDAICRASRVRSRSVSLREDWWKSDVGPLLAFRGDDATPLAVRPTRPGRYEIVDPAAKTVTRLTGRTAAQLAPNAFVLYRPLPDGPLSTLDVLRFALHGHLGDLVSVIAMGVGAGWLGLVVPLAMARIMNDIIPAADRGQLLHMSLGMIAVLFGAVIFQFVQSIATLRLEGWVSHDCQAAVWDRILRLPIPFFRRFSSGDLAQRANGINEIRQYMTSAAMSAILSLFTALSQFALLFAFSMQLALVATAVALVTVTVSVIGGTVQVRYSRRRSEIRGKIAGLVFQLIRGNAKLRIAGAQTRAFGVWSDLFCRERQLNFDGRRIGNVFNALYGALDVVSTGVIFYGIATFMESPGSRGGLSMSTGDFLAFQSAFGVFYSSTLGMARTAIGMLDIVPIWERARPILETSPEADTLKADPGRLQGDVEVSHVSFRYVPDGPLILDDVTLRARPGEFVAIVGPSGSGKSTLLRMLVGFDQPEAGTIFFDGKALPSVDARRVRRQIGVVLQGGTLVAGHLYANIIGSLPLSIEDAWEAARMAGFDRDIKTMPMGMQTVITEDASTLSGGQRQRLLIARALVSRPRIVIFDEATSALDNETQAIVTRSLAQLQATRIVIAHRLSTIQNADRIYVVEKGKVVESGRYDELISLDGLFAKLARRQLVEGA